MATSPTPLSLELPVVGAEPRERADAVRNRALILTTAERLFREQGVGNVSMDAIACAAGVGKGTLFRRFGDRSSLVRSLIGDRETAFQEGFIRGAPPLGPGAPPLDRVIAFGRELLDFTACHGEFILAAETGSPGLRYRSQVYAVYHAHVTMLVRSGAPELDAGFTAHALLGMLGADLVTHQLQERGMPLADLKAGYEAVARRVLS